MNLTIQAGTVTGRALQSWLTACGDTGGSLQPWLREQGEANVHALIEYVHRFAFVDWSGFLQDMGKEEIAELCLRGRVFWETGQITWRRLDPSQCLLCLILEGIPSPPLPAGFQAAGKFSEEITSSEDSCLILWGTYNLQEGIFIEQRVAGSRPLEYPQAIASVGKTYPILEVRTYLNGKGEPSLWRFLRPGARDMKDWPKQTEEEA